MADKNNPKVANSTHTTKSFTYASESGILTEAAFDRLIKDMRNNMLDYESPPLNWISSFDIKKLKVYWWNPFSVFRYLKTRHQVMKIAVDITKSLPKANPYPTLSQTELNDLVGVDFGYGKSYLESAKKGKQ